MNKRWPHNSKRNKKSYKKSQWKLAGWKLAGFRWNGKKIYVRVVRS